MLARVRGVLLMASLAACAFEHGLATTTDAPPPDIKPDMVVATWEIDSASKKGVPSASFQWSDLLNAAGLSGRTPDHVWLMQETSGSLTDSIGAIALDPVAAPSYRNVVMGWSRAAVGTSQIATDHGFRTYATGNLMGGTSYLVLLYVAVMGAPTTERSLVGIGYGTDHRYVSLTNAPVFKGTGIGVTPTAGTLNPMTEVHPIVVEINANQLQYIVYTDQERLSVGWAGTSGNGDLFMVGNGIIGAASARYLYGALWIGSKAEMTDADVKKLLQTLGWTVTGY
jgi:hypothetical protein